MGGSEWLAVYEDGLLEMRWSELVDDPKRGFAREHHQLTMRVPATRLDALRTALASTEFAAAEPHYNEEGVLDGGALTIADMATHHRRVIVVNEPADLPAPVARAEAMLWELHELVRKKGERAFAVDAADRLLVVYSHPHGEDSRQLTVFANGSLELRTTYTSSDKAHAERDYPTPRSVTSLATEEEFAALTDAIAGMPSPQHRPGEANRRYGDVTLRIGVGEFPVPLDNPPAELARLLAAADSIASRLTP